MAPNILNDTTSVLEENFCHSHCHQKKWGNVDIVNRQHVIRETCKVLGIQAVKKDINSFGLCIIKSDVWCKVLCSRVFVDTVSYFLVFQIL